MTYEEAIEILKRNKPTSDPRLCGKELCTACDVAIEALEKQIPKKPNKLNCPHCSFNGIDNSWWVFSFCPECGQRIDWE